MCVFRFYIGFAVKRDLNHVPLVSHLQRMPGVGCDRRIDVLDRLARAIHGVVERDVVFERVGPSDIVVIAILPAPDKTSRLVFFPGNRFEPYLDGAVCGGYIVFDTPGKRRLAGLLEHIRRTRCRVIPRNSPARTTFSGRTAGPAGRRLANRVALE